MSKKRGRVPTFDLKTRKYFAKLIQRHGLRGAGENSQIPVSQPTLARVAREFCIRLQAGRRLSDVSQAAQTRLTEIQEAQLAQIVMRGPMAAGYSSGAWTCRRITDVVLKSFGIKCHPMHLKAVLSKLGLQVIERRVYLIRSVKPVLQMPEDKPIGIASGSKAA